MPERVIMHLRNSRHSRFAAWPIALLLLSIGAWAQRNTPPDSPPRSSQPPPPPAKTTLPPGATPSSAPPPGQEPGADSGTFVFRADVQEVLVHATVIDDKQRMITNLDQNAFTVFEDGKPQIIKSFRHEDVPISLGIVIDNSGSMREKRAKVAKAAVNRSEEHT